MIYDNLDKKIARIKDYQFIATFINGAKLQINGPEDKEFDVKSQKHVDASEEIPEFVGWLPTDIVDGFESEEFFENIETIFRDTFLNDKDVVNHMEKNIKKVNLEKLLLSDKEEKLY